MDKLLIVDDSPTFIKLILKELEKKLTFEYVLCSTMSETEEVLKNSCPNEFSLAILDLILPDAPTGKHVDIVLNQKIPSIIITGIDKQSTIQCLYKKNIIDYIIKSNKGSLTYLANLTRRILRNREIKILLVEDSKTYRYRLKNMFLNQLFQVFEASDGVEGLEILENNRDIKLLLTDYYMPNMDGEQLILKAREMLSSEELAVIVISRSEDKKNVPRFIKLGANDFLQKPFSQEEFNCKVNHYVETVDNIEIIKRLANIDVLTNLYNRRFFFESFEREFSRALRYKHTLACIMIDIDHFKLINDKHGHLVGDLVIQTAATIIRKSCRRSDTVARYGGEEFVVLVPETDEKGIKILAEKIRKSLEFNRLKVEDQHLKFTISLGTVVFSHKNLTEIKEKDIIIKYADKALYKAKEKGRNRVETFSNVREGSL